jgi:hypothetical protein
MLSMVGDVGWEEGIMFKGSLLTDGVVLCVEEGMFVLGVEIDEHKKS